MRLDQWLWAIRVFKSRAQAQAAIKAARVRVDGALCKPAHEPRPGEIVSVSDWDRERSWRVLGVPERRVGAKLVATYAEAHGIRPAS